MTWWWNEKGDRDGVISIPLSIKPKRISSEYYQSKFGVILNLVGYVHAFMITERDPKPCALGQVRLNTDEASHCHIVNFEFTGWV